MSTKWGTDQGIYRAPKRATYKYGMRFLPWMAVQRIEEIKRDEDKIFNYIVENCSSGFSGVLVRFFDVVEPQTNRSDEWLEVYHFDTGDESNFQAKWKKGAKQLLRCVPRNPGSNGMSWQPHGAWRIFKQIKRIPAKQT
ncbi:hypothetical protein A2Z53_02275 [Candidatus Giovannonibacteria bacterium RIFCSPHIGHO2_02_42_15]|uniref:Uncharacterized protein n=2 Tax=Candidatus Giovannoniibacteriota TaxID=1752738 RepID=A0A1F5VLB7_9BACT|nr:MAG: hypothetical protein A2Z53_02275 [Candidatus Giovannonibacteria bacterium RIFCSPHIGHO2_02_42_15]